MSEHAAHKTLQTAISGALLSLETCTQQRVYLLVKGKSSFQGGGRKRKNMRESKKELHIHAVHLGVILASIELGTFRCRSCHTLFSTAAQHLPVTSQSLETRNIASELFQLDLPN